MSDVAATARPPVAITEAMIAAAHECIDWQRDGQNTRLLEHPSQQDVINGVTVGTTCRTDIVDALRAALTVAGFEVVP